jgi:NAD+ synthase
MNNGSLKINPLSEERKITSFIKDILKTQGFKNVVIGLSGGIDSAVSLALLSKSINPENIYVAHLYHFNSEINFLKLLTKQFNIPEKNIYNISIKKSAEEIKNTIGLTSKSSNYQLRFGNIMARVRMIALYDLAKKHHALVCGTENKSEFFLGYFTRFGDEASDFEPIRHLYKTQIYQLAKHLNIPEKIIKAQPTAGLHPSQTDEKDFGFSYKEADQVLNLYIDKKEGITKISSLFPSAEIIISRLRSNSFKHNLPYVVK